MINLVATYLVRRGDVCGDEGGSGCYQHQVHPVLLLVVHVGVQVEQSVEYGQQDQERHEASGPQQRAYFILKKITFI